MSTRVKLSQHTAILIERARRFGMSQQELVEAVQGQNVAAFAKAEAEYYTYGDLFQYSADHGENLIQAVTEGYQITFNTRNGLKIWLEQTLGQQSEVDFTVGEGIIEGLKVTDAEAQLVKEHLAFNWIIANVEQVDGGQVLTLQLRPPAVTI